MYKLSESTFREPMEMTCEQAETAMLAHMETTISLKDARRLAAHVESCETCREYYLAFDETMEYAASAEADWLEAPQGFTASVMAAVQHMPVYAKPEVVEKIRSRGQATLHILWGVSAILFGIALFFAFNPQQFTNLIHSYPVLHSVTDFFSNAAAAFGQGVENALNAHTMESGIGIAALLFTLVLGSLLVVLHTDQRTGEKS